MSCLDKLPILDIDKENILNNLKDGKVLSKSYIKSYLIKAIDNELNLRNKLRKTYPGILEITRKELLVNFTNEFDPDKVYDATENKLAVALMKLIKNSMSRSEAVTTIYPKLLSLSNEVDYINLLGNIDKVFDFNGRINGAILKTAIMKIEQDKVIASNVMELVNQISDLVGTC